MPAGDAAAEPLRALIRRFELRADKRLGQHFLLDPGILGRIARAAGDLAGGTVLEVGPGPGGLTRALLATAAARVIAVERDPRCIAALQPLVAAAAGRLSVIEADALEVRLDQLADGPLTIVANLPYNVGTALLLRWLDQLGAIAQMVLMFQREVGDRLSASPGSRSYGRLSVLAQWLCRVERVMHLPAAAFVPPPKVASSLLRLTPRPEPLAPAVRRDLERVLAAAFGQRRKMLRASLKPVSAAPETLLAAASIPPTARAEDLDIAAFCRLAQALRAAA
jgi:16S rRNA (adenine1518-N6/adenine1519-N6)-dimethyltransferase